MAANTSNISWLTHDEEHARGYRHGKSNLCGKRTTAGDQGIRGGSLITNAPATNMTAMKMVQIVLALEVDGMGKHARAAVEVGVFIWVLLMQRRYQGRRENAGKAKFRVNVRKTNVDTAPGLLTTG